jgi:putative hemolysin
MKYKMLLPTQLLVAGVVAALTACSPITVTSMPQAAAPTAVVVDATAPVSATASVSATTGVSGTTLANPASQNCIAQGGALNIEKRGDGGEFGVCIFEDNLQCEEWAMLRGACPVGGIKITGYLTPAARYCALTGGSYADNGTTSADNEQGACTLPSGTVCAALDYYNGQCLDQ